MSVEAEGSSQKAKRIQKP